MKLGVKDCGTCGRGAELCGYAGGDCFYPAYVMWAPKPIAPASAPGDNYRSLRAVLDRAYDQAATGKGAQRHGQDLPFEVQPMQTISNLVGSHDGLLYQAIKKTQESQRMGKDAAVRELLGAINYLAGAVIHLEKAHG